VESDDNANNALTINVSKDIYVKHANEFLGRHDNSNLQIIVIGSVLESERKDVNEDFNI
jgi:hypothetical protein